MNLKNASMAAAAILLACMSPACSSDPNPVGYLDFEGQDAKTFVELDFSALGTRASTSDEAAIKKVKLYIFDENDKLESISDMKTVEGLKIIAETTPGQKTIYAISANDILTTQAAIGMTMTEFENLVFSSQLSDIQTSDGFVMVGKSEKTEIKESKSPVNLPEGNKLSINMERLVAKVAVATEVGMIGGLSIYKKDFKVFQTNDQMRLKSNGSDISQFSTHSNGTFSGYTFDDNRSYSEVGTSDYQYMSENIVANPTSGNTTFVCLRTQVCATPLLSNNSMGTLNSNDNYSSITFFVIGIVKSDNPQTVIDYFKYYNNIYYYDSEAAARTGIELYTQNSPLPAGYEYKPIGFDNGYMYYRINIAEGTGDARNYKVTRNKAYKITIESINDFGAPTVDALCPADPNTALDEGESVSSAWGDATFTVVDWNSSDQTENL